MILKGSTMKDSGLQRSIFDGVIPLKITKPLRLIELFAGIGAQAKALENLGIKFEHYRICEFDKYAVASYNAVHGTTFSTSDITKIHAEDLGIADTDRYEYIMTYSFPCTDLSKAGKQQGMSRESGTQKAFKEGHEKAQADIEEKLENGELVSKEWHDEQVLHAEDEIERLKAQLHEYKKPIDKFIKDRENQAVKEFAARLKKRITDENGTHVATLTVKGIDLILKEYEK